MSGYQPKTYRKQGGDEFVVANGGAITIEPGGKIQSPDGSVVADLKRYQTKQVADISAEATYYMTARYAGKITKLSSITDGAVSTADVTATFSINGVAVTDGVITIATAGSAAGDQDEVVPSAANTVAIGDVISFVVSGGGAGGSPRAEFTAEITAQ